MDPDGRISRLSPGPTIDVRDHKISKILETLSTRINHIIVSVPDLETSTLYSSRVFLASHQSVERLNASAGSSMFRQKPTWDKQHIYKSFEHIHFDRFNILHGDGLLLRHRTQRGELWELMQKVDECNVGDEEVDVLREFGNNLYEVAITMKTPIQVIYVQRDSSPRRPYNDNQDSNLNEQQRRPNAEGELREDRLEVYANLSQANQYGQRKCIGQESIVRSSPSDCKGTYIRTREFFGETSSMISVELE